MSWRLADKYLEENLLEIALCTTSTRNKLLCFTLENTLNIIMFLFSLLFPHIIWLNNLLLLMQNLKTLMIFHKLGQQMHALSNIFPFVL